MIEENYKRVLENINSDDVKLIAVSKTHPAELIKEVYDLGQRDFGENKVQEILAKAPLLPSDIRWHLIGHLQRNKVKSIIDKVVLIHSLDSIRLAREIDLEAGKAGLIMPVLIEVNIGNEESKTGFLYDEVIPSVREIAGYKNIRVKGLMCVPPASENPEESRKFFALLKNLSIDIKALNIDNIEMKILSMGMTNDYSVAIQEGSNMVRVGTAIFGTRIYTK